MLSSYALEGTGDYQSSLPARHIIPAVGGMSVQASEFLVLLLREQCFSTESSFVYPIDSLSYDREVVC